MSIFGIDGALAPYLILIFFGFLPSEIWRFVSVFVARRIDENSEIFVYVRTIAAVLLHIRDATGKRPTSTSTGPRQPGHLPAGATSCSVKARLPR